MKSVKKRFECWSEDKGYHYDYSILGVIIPLMFFIGVLDYAVFLGLVGVLFGSSLPIPNEAVAGTVGVMDLVLFGFLVLFLNGVLISVILSNVTGRDYC